jgi:hypothetical protein
MTPERKGWLAHWKEQAVGKLPTFAPVQAKVALRHEVERALATYGPEDAAAELTDIVTALVADVTTRLATERTDQERADRREQLLSSITLLVDDGLLRGLPVALVGAPHSVQRRAVLATLRRSIHDALAAEFTGEESLEYLMERVGEEFVKWVVQQNPRLDRRNVLKQFAPWLLTAVVGGTAAVGWSPELKAAARKAAQVLRDRLTPYKPVVRCLARSTVHILEQWITEEAKQAQVRKEQREQQAQKKADQQKEKAS